MSNDNVIRSKLVSHDLPEDCKKLTRERYLYLWDFVDENMVSKPDYKDIKFF